MSKMKEISALLDIEDEELKKPVVTSVLLTLEEYLNELKEKNRTAPLAEITENLGKLFECFLMDMVEPTPQGLDFVRKTIALLINIHEDPDKEKGDEFIAEASEINRDLGLLTDGKQIGESSSDQETDHGEKKTEETSPPQISEDEPIDYDLPITSEEDSLSYTGFVEESTEHIENIEGKILELENSPDDSELINAIFRPFHSMKGAAGFLGLLDINKLSHEAENVLDLARKNKIKIGRDMINVLLESIDIVKRLLLITSARVDQKLGKLPKDKKIQSIPIGRTIKRLEHVASQTVTEEKAEHSAGSKLGEILVQKGNITPKQFEEALETQSKKIGEILIDKGATTPDKIQEALNTQQQVGKKVVPPIKVDTEKLDILMELVGELVIAQTLVGQDDVLLNELNQDISKNISNLGKITKTLQEQVMAIRMVPIKQTFMKMHRLVRDVSLKTNKKVELRLSGEETEIDKTTIDELSDPLVHLLRNSVEHGIETPEERKKAGKPETGLVQLNAYHQGGNIVIEIIDDGKGLSKDKIYEKALEKNLLNKDTSYTDQEIFNLILLPGFSTVEKASDISGRGVGMDVVSGNIKKLGGKLEIQSKIGSGSVFTIKLPLTMSIVDGMVVQAGTQRFIIPIISILESIRPEKSDISTVKKKGELINVRGQLYPLIRLHKLFDIEPIHQNPWDALIILVESNERIKGVMIDDLHGQQQVVIKNLGKIFRTVKEISGGAILGDGRVGLILDVEGVISSC